MRVGTATVLHRGSWARLATDAAGHVTPQVSVHLKSHWLCSSAAEVPGFCGLESESKLERYPVFPLVPLAVEWHMVCGVTCCWEAPTEDVLSSFLL